MPFGTSLAGTKSNVACDSRSFSNEETIENVEVVGSWKRRRRKDILIC